jgi:hypothetical protein
LSVWLGRPGCWWRNVHVPWACALAGTCVGAAGG